MLGKNTNPLLHENYTFKYISQFFLTCPREKILNKIFNFGKFSGSDYFDYFAWPCGRVATNKILANFDCGSIAAWPQPQLFKQNK